MHGEWAYGGVELVGLLHSYASKTNAPTLMWLMVGALGPLHHTTRTPLFIQYLNVRVSSSKDYDLFAVLEGYCPVQFPAFWETFSVHYP